MSGRWDEKKDKSLIGKINGKHALRDGAIVTVGGLISGYLTQSGLESSFTDMKLLRLGEGDCTRLVFSKLGEAAKVLATDNMYTIDPSKDHSVLTVCVTQVQNSDNGTSTEIVADGLSSLGDSGGTAIANLYTGATKIFELGGKIFCLRVEDMQNQLQSVDLQVLYDTGKDNMSTVLFHLAGHLTEIASFFGIGIMTFGGLKLLYERILRDPDLGKR